MIDNKIKQFHKRWLWLDQDVSNDVFAFCIVKKISLTHGKIPAALVARILQYCLYLYVLIPICSDMHCELWGLI